MDELKIGRIYRHFKNKYYLLIDIAVHSETLEEYIVYRATYGDCITYIRPRNAFLEQIDINRKDNITKQKYRFELVESINDSICE